MKKNPVLFAIILIIMGISIFLQPYLLKNNDVCWLLQATQQFLQGGKYYYDFMETNPPMILYLYMIPIGISKVLHISLYLAFWIYIYTIAVSMLVLCQSLIKKIIHEKHRLISSGVLIALTASFVLLPVYIFGEREHIMLMLTMPYILLIPLRVNGKKTGFWLNMIIGLLAGVGLSLKPFFLFTPLLLELYLMIRTRKLCSWLRTETIVIATILITYFISIFIITPEYIHLVLPLVMNLYFAGYQTFWIRNFTQPIFICCMLTIIPYFIAYPDLRYKTLSTTLLLSLIGFIGAHLWHGQTWYYHLIPAIAVATTLLGLLLTESLSTLCDNPSQHTRRIHYIILSLIIFILAYGPFESFTEIAYLTRIKPVKPQIEQAQQLITHYNDGRPIFILTDSIISYVLLTTYTHSQSASRFPFDDFLPGLMRRLSTTKNRAQLTQLNQMKNELINLTIQDFQKHKPLLAFIINYGSPELFQGEKFDYIKFFSQESRFRKIWRQYHYLTTIKITSLKFLVFYRKPTHHF